MSNSQALQQIDIIKIYEKKRCLVVDDLTEVRAAYKRMLRAFGVREIDTAATGDQAMEMVEGRDYGIIVCDYNLDDSKDGQQVLEELRHMQLLKYTTLFIIITAETSREMVLGAIENQPDDYITKPISQKMMRTRIDRALLKHEDLFQIKAGIDNRQYKRALKLCDEKIQAKSRYESDCIRYKAQIYWMMGDIQNAKQIYEDALEEKDYVWAKLGLVRAMMKLDQLDHVESILKGIIRDDHRYIEAHDILSEYYERVKQPVKAQNATFRATELSPKSILRHRRLAELAEENGDDDTCLRAYEEAIRWNYSSCHAEAEDYLSLARKTVSMTKGKTDRDSIDKNKKALSLLDRMNRRFPQRKNKVKSGLIEAQLYANQGKVSFAKSALEQAEQEFEILEPKEMDARLDYAQSQLLVGDKQKAYKELQIIYRESKDDRKILERIDKISDEPITVAGKQCAAELSRAGIEAYNHKEYDKALGIFDDALRMFPNHIGVNLNMVQVALAKTENDGKTTELYNCCKKCLIQVDDLTNDHKQYARHQFLVNQYTKLYSDYIAQGTN